MPFDNSSGLDDQGLVAGSEVFDEGFIVEDFDDLNLADFVDPTEFGLADGQDLAEDQYLPVVAVIGRPNVGKSTLVNRILGRRAAVVQDTPGVTRDRVAYDAQWNGRKFVIVDTGGWISDAKGLAAQIAEQAEMAISSADAVLFVVDGQVGVLDEDDAVVNVLRRANKPVILVANKVDDARLELESSAMWSLGLGYPYPVSAIHGRGSGEMLDALLEVLPQQSEKPTANSSGIPRIAVVGKPNVGKSSLLNKLAGQSRSVVSDISGTTVDPVDEVVEIAQKPYLLIDTAGIRRRVKEASGHEYYASLRTQTAIDRCQVCVVVIDASEPISDQDLRILSMVEQTGRGMVIAFNKWDLLDDERRFYLKREIERDLVGFKWAPGVNISALTGRNLEKMAKWLDLSLSSWTSRIATSKLNSFIGTVVAAHPHPLRGGKQPRILFATQSQTCPPTFTLFTTGNMDAGYIRFIERRLREEFGFEGSPVHINVRPRAKRNGRN